MFYANINGKIIFLDVNPLSKIDYGDSLKTYAERDILQKIGFNNSLKEFIEKTNV